MRRILIYIFIAFSSSLYSQSNDIFKIYGSLIQKEYGKDYDIIAIKNQTALFDSLGQSDFEYFKLKFKNLNKETFESLIENNKVPDTLLNHFTINKRILIFNREELGQFFENDSGSIYNNGWDAFYNKCGKTQGILTFSNIGFDKLKNQALLYFGNQSYWLSGAGHYAFFVKRGKHWILKNKFMIWIS